MSKTVWRITPVNGYDLPALAGWLEKMADREPKTMPIPAVSKMPSNTHRVARLTLPAPMFWPV